MLKMSDHKPISDETKINITHAVLDGYVLKSIKTTYKCSMATVNRISKVIKLLNAGLSHAEIAQDSDAGLTEALAAIVDKAIASHVASED